MTQYSRLDPLVAPNPDSAWSFNFNNGYQNRYNPNKTNSFYALVVLDGDVAAVVPVPAVVWLFSSGLIGLLGLARRKR